MEDGCAGLGAPTALMAIAQKKIAGLKPANLAKDHPILMLIYKNKLIKLSQASLSRNMNVFELISVHKKELMKKS